MPLAATAALLSDAVGRSVGVGAFNVITLEHAEAILAAAEQRERPIILQLSQNAVAFHAGRPGPITAAMRVLAEHASVPVALHLDHVEDEELLHQAADAGFGSVMFDAGRLSYERNVEATAAAAQWAHENGLTIEAELGYVGGKETQVGSAHTPGVRTDPAQAAQFVAETGVDALAVAVGSSHAMTSRSARLDADLIRALAAAVPVPLVLHGSSGVPDDELRAAISAGIVKVNIGTILNVAFTGAVRETLATIDSVDPRKYLGPARDAMTQTVAALLDVLDARSD